MRNVALYINSHEKTQSKPSLLLSYNVGSLYFLNDPFSKIILSQTASVCDHEGSYMSVHVLLFIRFFKRVWSGLRLNDGSDLKL